MRIKAAIILAAALLFASCTKNDPVSGTGTASDVMIMYSAGNSNLFQYLASDLEDLKGEGLDDALPKPGDGRRLILVTQNAYNGTPPIYVVDVKRDFLGRAACDTLLTLNDGSQLTSAPTMRRMLEFVRDEVPAERYGMVFSSHGTGWLPEEFYSTYSESSNVFSTRSIGMHWDKDFNCIEMTIQDFADALPFNVEYMLIDACLMGGVETAWQLRDRCGLLAFSQTEILAEGFDYSNLVRRLLVERNPLGAAQDYFAQYEAKTGVSNSATISVVDCTAMEPLATVCKDLFERYRAAIAAVDPDRVQGYFRFGRHFFYDLRDILVKSGVADADIQRLDTALEGCVLYEAHTDNFMGSFDITDDCGLSMYLPCDGCEELDIFYRKLDWNKATGLVK